MDNLEKLATYGEQDEEEQKQYVRYTTMLKQTQIT